MSKMFPVIDLVATGENITRLRKAKGLTVRDMQNWFGFEEPQAIYKWQKGKSLPTVDNLYALGTLLDVPMEEILVPRKPELNIVSTGQQDVSCCPPLLSGKDYFDTGTASCHDSSQYAKGSATRRSLCSHLGLLPPCPVELPATTYSLGKPCSGIW